MANGYNDAFRIVVGANYNLSIEQLKKDIGNILRRLPKESRSITVRAKMDDVSGLQHDLTNMSNKLKLTLKNVDIAPSQVSLNGFGSSIERALRNAGGVGVPIVARQDNVLNFGTDVENELAKTGGIIAPLGVNQNSIAGLQRSLQAALAQLPPDSLTLPIDVNTTNLAQQIGNTLQSFQNYRLNLRVNLQNLPPRNNDPRIPNMSRDMVQLYNAVTQMNDLDRARSRPLFGANNSIDANQLAEISAAAEQARASWETLLQLNPDQWYTDAGEATRFYLLNQEAIQQAAARFIADQSAYNAAMQRGTHQSRDRSRALREETTAQNAHNKALRAANKIVHSLETSTNPAAQQISTRVSDARNAYLHPVQPRTTDAQRAQALRDFEQVVREAEGSLAELDIQTEHTDARLQRMLDNRLGFTLLALAIQLVKKGIMSMYTTIIDLDSAMTELRKVTDETEETYNKFLSEAADRAKKLGAALNDVVLATADFARLGFDISAASDLADAAIVYKNVGDGITNIDEASESIISTMQAFGIEARDAMTIVDKFNITGNKFAISSGGVGDALMNSAAALSSANNTLEESIALITAANTTIQNPERVGTTLKTVSMFLRAAKTEAEEAGESTEGMADSVSKLREEILSLTGQRVDIMMPDGKTFKSTFQIMKELSNVWEDLSDISQANILEKIGGKRNSNVVSALIKNFEIAEASLSAAMSSDGSALAENEKFLESIAGKLEQLSATWQEFSAATFDNEVVKFAIESLSKILNLLMGLDSATGGLSSSVLVTLAGCGILLESIRALGGSAQNAVLSIANMRLVTQNTVGPLRLTGAAAYAAAAGYMALAAAAVWFGYKVYQSWKKAHPTVEDLKTQYAELQQECDELNQTIEDNIARISELQELANNGSISIVEQAELNRLREMNELLKMQRDLKEADLREQGAEIAAASLSKIYGNVFSMYSNGETDRFTAIADATSKYDELQAEYKIALSVEPENQDRELIDHLESQLENVKAFVDSQLTTVLAEVSYLDPARSEAEAAAIREISKAYNTWKLKIGEVSDVQSVFNDILAKAEYESAKTHLMALASTGQLTSKKLAEMLASSDHSYIGVKKLVDELVDLNVVSGDNHLQQIVNLIMGLGDAAIETAGALSDVVNEVEILVDQYDLLKAAQEEYAETGSLSLKTLSSLTEKYPSLSADVALYLAGLKSAKELMADIKSEYESDVDAYNHALSDKLANSSEYYSILLNNNGKYIDELNKMYGVDLKNFKTLESAKLEFSTQIISRLASNYAKYNGASLKFLKREYTALENRIANAPGFDEAWQLSLERHRVGAAIADIERYIADLEELGNMTAVQFDPSKFSNDADKDKDDKPDYDAQYKWLLDEKKLAEQNNERLKRMDGDWSKERLHLLEVVRDKAIKALEDAADKSAEEKEYLEDLLWELNDAMAEIYENQMDAIENIIDLTTEMIKEDYEDRIDAIEEQTDAYNDLIDAKKKSLEADKKAADYNRKVAEKTKEIAKIQSKIAILSLDDSREAAAKRLELEEELAKLQTDLADMQADQALEITKDALDESADAHEKANDERVDALKELLKDEEYLYKEAIEKIGNMEDAFYKQLEQWAKAHGEDIRKLADDWDIAKNAKQGYVDLDAAMSGIAASKDNLESTTDKGSYNTARANEILAEMQQNSKWAKENKKTVTDDGVDLHLRNNALKDEYYELTGIKLTYDKTKGWCYPNGKPAYKFHQGGIAGGHGSLRDNEIMSILEKNELILENGRKMNLGNLFDNLRETVGSLVSANLFNNMSRMRGAVPAVAGGNTIAPSIQVNITHNGEMTDADAKRYGDMVGNEAIKKLRDAFTKRGF